MRDRLIELITKSHCVDTWNHYTDDFKEPNPIYELADLLLADGVIVPPCKVGDTVYVIFEKKIYEAIVEQLTVSDVLKGKRIIRIRAEFEIEDWFYNDSRKTTYGIYRDWQDDIFLTKEEAEAALKGGAE